MTQTLQTEEEKVKGLEKSLAEEKQDNEFFRSQLQNSIALEEKQDKESSEKVTILEEQIRQVWWSMTQMHFASFLRHYQVSNISKCFSKQGLILFFDSVLGPLHLVQYTGLCPCYSVVLETTHETKLRALQGSASSKQNTLQAN